MVFSGGEILNLRKKNYRQTARGIKKMKVSLDNFVACLFLLTRSTMAWMRELGKPTSLVSKRNI